MSEAVQWELSGFGDEIDADPRVQAAVMRALGAGHIEVRSAWGTNIVDLSEEQLGELKSVLDEAGLKASAIASPIGKVDVALPVEHELERLGRALRAAEVLGAPYIRIFSFYYEGKAPEEVRDAVIERMTALARRAEGTGVVLVHENEKDIFGDVPERVLDIVESVDSPALKLAWDPANFVQCGVKPFTEGYEELRPHVVYLQVKDALASSGKVVPAGEGDGEVLRTVEALRDSGYSGFASLEPHLAYAYETGGFSGPFAFGVAARAFAKVLEAAGVEAR
ncbi:xylose isomerase [Sinomonas atrocyanea]|uniref:Xylose isomerase n=1 Tax=Sinomonas atrocyanea TaxID=37927 RepID=A0A126ZW47_9MICC|nr:sugar phosphate isomerase/epimerase family protein [Sinomonas atrocyanea]AMM31116.1 xylose isomerase [Sinomonas atrocyanea]GEB65864.1 xylose isomerase [Sinomonas atrocyanea]GGG54677.1 xylose isomerase [Sinomonas atrocyanea]